MIAQPLTNFLKANTDFKFESRDMKTFESLKTVLCNYIGAATELHTDASYLGHGAILMHLSSDNNKFHRVYFASGKTTPTEKKYSSYQLEALAIIKSLKKFRVYLLSMPFVIVTDCPAFMMTMKKKDLCVRVARWALLLDEFNYTVLHRLGKKMSHLDAISRKLLPRVMLLNECENAIFAKLRKAQHDDVQLQKIFSTLVDNTSNNYEIRNGLLCRIVMTNF